MKLNWNETLEDDEKLAYQKEGKVHCEKGAMHTKSQGWIIS